MRLRPSLKRTANRLQRRSRPRESSLRDSAKKEVQLADASPATTRTTVRTELGNHAGLLRCALSEARRRCGLQDRIHERFCGLGRAARDARHRANLVYRNARQPAQLL